MNKFSIAGIVPAAGVSKRMGQDKRLLPIGSMTLLEKSVTSLIEGGCNPVIVVFEPGSPCLRLPLFLPRPDMSVVVVTLKELSPSMLNTIREGLKRVPEDVQAVTVLPGDCPLIAPSLVRLLVEKMAQERFSLLVPTCRGQQGHPRFVSKEMFGNLRALPLTEKFSAIFKMHADKVVYFETGDVSIVADADTPEEYQALLKSVA